MVSGKPWTLPFPMHLVICYHVCICRQLWCGHPLGNLRAALLLRTTGPLIHNRHL